MYTSFQTIVSAFFIGCINSMVHSLMYTYYLIASLGEPYKRYLWWKKYLTSIQMVINILHRSQLPSPTRSLYQNHAYSYLYRIKRIMIEV